MMKRASGDGVRVVGWLDWLCEEEVFVMADALQRVLAGLAGFAHLPVDWDSYGGLPSTARAIARAGQVLSAAAERFAPAGGSGVMPELIAPLADGGVHLEWRSPHADLEVEVTPQGELGYLLVRKGADGQEERQYEEADDVPLSAVLALLATILG